MYIYNKLLELKMNACGVVSVLQAQIQTDTLILILSSIIIRTVFRIHANMNDGAFYENS